MDHCFVARLIMVFNPGNSLSQALGFLSVISIPQYLEAAGPYVPSLKSYHKVNSTMKISLIHNSYHSTTWTKPPVSLIRMMAQLPLCFYPFSLDPVLDTHTNTPSSCFKT